MNWTDKQQTLFDELRARELTGTLTTEEQTQLAELMAMLEATWPRLLPGCCPDAGRADRAA